MYQLRKPRADSMPYIALVEFHMLYFHPLISRHNYIIQLLTEKIITLDVARSLLKKVRIWLGICHTDITKSCCKGEFEFMGDSHYSLCTKGDCHSFYY